MDHKSEGRTAKIMMMMQTYPEMLLRRDDSVVRLNADGESNPSLPATERACDCEPESDTGGIA